MRARLAEHLRSGQVSKVVYGSIIGLALVLTMQAHPPEVGAIVGTLLATAVAVSLAELYSEVLGARTRAGMGAPAEPMPVIVEHTLAVGFGVAFPSVFFVADLLALVDTDTAFALAKWTGLGLIAGYGFIAARLGGMRTSRALVEAGAAALIAGVLIGLKALVH